MSRYKKLEAKFNELKEELTNKHKEIDLIIETTSNMQKDINERFISNLKKRDYLVGTNFNGVLTNIKLKNEIKEYKKNIYSILFPFHRAIDTVYFYDIKAQILNYDFEYLNEIYDKLKELEQKQLDLDKYAEDKPKATKPKKENKS